jgi:hypothetical protein
MKDTFDKKVKADIFKAGDLVLKWDAARQEKGKHGKFDALWTGPFLYHQYNRTTLLFSKSGR